MVGGFEHLEGVGHVRDVAELDDFRVNEPRDEVVLCALLDVGALDDLLDRPHTVEGFTGRVATGRNESRLR